MAESTKYHQSEVCTHLQKHYLLLKGTSGFQQRPTQTLS